MEKIEHDTDKLFRDRDDPRNINFFIDWFLRRYYPDEVSRLQGDADYIYFKRITFDAEHLVEIEYTTYNDS